jgi:hypothetical protein
MCFMRDRVNGWVDAALLDAETETVSGDALMSGLPLTTLGYLPRPSRRPSVALWM